MTFSMLRKLSCVAVAAAVMFAIQSAQAVTVFLDDLDDPNGTVLDGKAPDIGGAVWDQTAGTALTVQDGEIDTSGGARTGFGFFTQTLGAGNTLVFDFNTNDVPGGNFHSGGFAGLSLNSSTQEHIFIGDLGNGDGASPWGISEVGGVGDILTTEFDTNQDNGRFTYNFDTGGYQLLFDNAVVLSGTFGAGKDIDRVRFTNGGGGDIAIDSLQIGFTENKFVFADDFDDPNGTILDGKAPDIGIVWDQTAGPNVTIENGAIDTTGAARTAFGIFNDTLGANDIIELEFDTDDVPGNNFHSGGFAGISLFDGAQELIFIGDLGNGDGASPWGISEVGGVGDILTSVFPTNQDNVKFTYNFNTGEYVLTFDGILALTGFFDPGKEIDRVRFINGGGGDIKINDLSAAFVPVPEPTSLALLTPLALAALRRRRR